MAYYDYGAEMQRQANEESYNKLKKMTNSPEWRGAYDHMIKMEDTIKKQEEKLKEYLGFFGLLQKLLPEQFTINTIIG